MKKTLGAAIGAGTLGWTLCAAAQTQNKSELKYIQTLRDTAHSCWFSQDLASSAIKLNISRDSAESMRRRQ